MRRILRMVAASALVLAAPAFADSKDTRGGVLVQTSDVEPASLDPLFGNAPARDRMFLTPMLENPFVLNDKSEFLPQLATSWTIAPNEKSITFKLRDGVIFHDGTPFDAEAVKFNFDRIVDPEVKARARQFVVDLASTEVIDKLTVKVNFSAPSGAVLAGLANEAGMISSPKAVREGGREYGRNPVGTGPFKFVSWTSGNRLEVTRFDKYWGRDDDGAPLPYLDGLVTRFIVNTSIKVIEARSGSVHVTDVIQVKDYPQVEKDPQLQLVTNPLSNMQFMSFNLTRPPFNDINLRSAVVHAIDRAAIERVVTRGEGEVLKGIEPPHSVVYAKDMRNYTFDLNKAKELYKASGHSGVIKLSIIQRDPDTQIAQIIQAQLAAAGIKVQIESLERLAWGDKIYSHNYDIAIHRTNAPRVDPDMNFSAFYGRAAGANHTGIKDPVIHDAIDAARGTTNMEVRKRIYGEIQQRLFDNFYQLPIYWIPQKEIRRREVQGVRGELSGVWLYDRAWLAKPSN